MNFTAIKHLLAKYPDANTERFFNELIVAREYEMPTLLNIVDVGAHRGLFTFSKVGMARKIWAIEPNPENVAVLKDIITETNTQNIEVFQLAIAGGRGRRELGVDPGASGGGSLFGGGENRFEVETISLTEFIMSNNINWIDILKIDAESAEKEILNAPDIDYTLQRTYQVVGEAHGPIQEFSQPLERNGFTITVRGQIFLAYRA